MSSIKYKSSCASAHTVEELRSCGTRLQRPCPWGGDRSSGVVIIRMQFYVHALEELRYRNAAFTSVKSKSYDTHIQLIHPPGLKSSINACRLRVH